MAHELKSGSIYQTLFNHLFDTEIDCDLDVETDNSDICFINWKSINNLMIMPYLKQTITLSDNDLKQISKGEN